MNNIMQSYIVHLKHILRTNEGSEYNDPILR